MRRHLLTIGLLAFNVGIALAADPPDKAPDTTKADEDTLKTAGVGTDDTALIDFFKAKTLDDTQKQKIAKLITELGDDAYPIREKASSELVQEGAKAIALLKQAISQSRDIEIVRRAETCLDQLDKKYGTSSTVAAARLLASRKPAATAETLLKFAPFADDSYVLDTLRDSLTAVAVKDGKPDPVVKEALTDKQPVRRGLAGEALIRAGKAEDVPAVKKLLEDSDKPVRLRIGLAYVDKKDKSTIPGLIDLLAEMPRDQSSPVEELLSRIALEKSPNIPLGDDEATRKKCRDTWKEWWDKNGEGIDLAKIDLGDRQLGYTILSGRDNRTGQGRVVELDKTGKVRWEITGLMLPMDCQVLGSDRVLITDYSAGKVTERSMKGDVIWEKSIPNNPINSQRLSNGNTLIFSRNQIVEVDKDGKATNTIDRPNFDIMSGQRLKDGNYLIVSNRGQIIKLDAKGAELKTIAAGISGVMGSNVAVTPEGHYLVPNYPQNCVKELDADGKELKSFAVTQPTGVVRLPNGGMQVLSLYTQTVTELDREGKKVTDSRTDGQMYGIRRR